MDFTSNETFQKFYIPDVVWYIKAMGTYINSAAFRIQQTEVWHI